MPNDGNDEPDLRYMYIIYTCSIQASTWLGNDLVCSQRNNDSMAWGCTCTPRCQLEVCPRLSTPSMAIIPGADAV